MHHYALVESTEAFDTEVCSIMMHWPLRAVELELQRARQWRRGPMWTALRRKALRRWSHVLAVSFAIKLWRLWTSFMASPESGYVRRVVRTRFQMACFNK